MAEPIAEWIVTLDAQGALEALKEFSEQTSETLTALDKQAQAINPGQSFVTFASAATGALQQIDATLIGLGQRAESLSLDLDTSAAERSLADFMSAASAAMPDLVAGGRFDLGAASSAGSAGAQALAGVESPGPVGFASSLAETQPIIAPPPVSIHLPEPSRESAFPPRASEPSLSGIPSPVIHLAPTEAQPPAPPVVHVETPKAPPAETMAAPQPAAKETPVPLVPEDHRAPPSAEPIALPAPAKETPTLLVPEIPRAAPPVEPTPLPASTAATEPTDVPKSAEPVVLPPTFPKQPPVFDDVPAEQTATEPPAPRQPPRLQTPDELSAELDRLLADAMSKQRQGEIRQKKRLFAPAPLGAAPSGTTAPPKPTQPPPSPPATTQPAATDSTTTQAPDPAPSPPTVPLQELIDRILKLPGAKQFGFTPDHFAKMSEANVRSMAAKLGVEAAPSPAPAPTSRDEPSATLPPNFPKTPPVFQDAPTATTEPQQSQAQGPPSPAEDKLRQAALEVGAMEKGAEGFAKAIELAMQYSGGFGDLTKQLEEIRDQFKAGSITEPVARRAVGMVVNEARDRRSTQAAEAEEQRRQADQEQRKQDRDRQEKETAAKSVADLVQGTLKEALPWDDLILTLKQAHQQYKEGVLNEEELSGRVGEVAKEVRQRRQAQRDAADEAERKRLDDEAKRQQEEDEAKQLEADRKRLGEEYKEEDPAVAERLKRDTTRELKGKGGQIGFDAAFKEADESPVIRQFNDLHKRLRDLDREVASGHLTAEEGQRRVGGIVDEATARVQKQAAAWSGLKNIATAAIAAGVMRVSSLTSLGFQDTGEQAVSSHYQRLLGRQFAAIQAPLVMEGAGRNARLAGYMQGMTGDQQEAIRSMGMFAKTVMPVMGAMRLSSVLAETTGMAPIIPPGLAKLMGPLGIGVGVMAATPEGRESLIELVKAFEPAFKTLLEAAKELRPAAVSFAQAIRQFAPLVNLAASGITPGALIGGGIGYGFGGLQGAGYGAFAGQGLDTVFGRGTTASLVERFPLTTLALATRHPVAIAGAAAADMINESQDTTKLYKPAMGGLWASQITQEEARARLLRGEQVSQSAGGWLGLLGFGRSVSMSQLDAMRADSAGRSDLTGKPGGFEDITRTWERITEAATQVNLQQQIANNTATTNQLLEQLVNGGSSGGGGDWDGDGDVTDW